MRRTEALQGVRVAMFLNILHRWESAELNQAEAAELLGVGERTFRRWRDRYDEEGEAGLMDRRLGKTSGKRVPASPWPPLSPAQPSRPFPASISTRFCALRRSVRSAITIACRIGRSSCKSRRARCGRTSSKAPVKVHVYADGSHALFHGPRCIGRYDENGALESTHEAKRAA